VIKQTRRRNKRGKNLKFTGDHTTRKPQYIEWKKKDVGEEMDTVNLFYLEIIFSHSFNY